MFRSLVAAAVVGLLWTATCCGAITVSADPIVLEPDMADQVVPIFVESDPDEDVQGLNFRMRVGDGWGGPDYDHSGPTISAVDLIAAGTVFEPNHDPLNPPTAYSYSWSGSVNTAFGSVPADGVVAMVTFDTTGVDHLAYPGPWDVVFVDGLGNSTNFAGVGADLVPTTITINAGEVPEPGSWALLASLAGVAVVVRSLRRRRAA